jgi:hypothetical protein
MTMTDMMTETSLDLRPAQVMATAGRPGYVQVALSDDETVWARLALAVPYSPEIGDEVLLIRGGPAQAYVIGVLRGRGATTLRVTGDLRLEAPHGSVRIAAAKSLRLQSGQAIDLTAPRATFRLDRLNVLVQTLVQRLSNSFTWAAGLVQSKSRRSRTVADEGWFVRAGRAHVKTKDNVHINGKTIHLG